MENDRMVIEKKIKELNAKKKKTKHMYKFTMPHVWTHLYVHKKIMQGICVCVCVVHHD